MGTVVDLLGYKAARARGIRPGTARVAAESDPSAYAPGWEITDSDVLRSEEYEHDGKTARITTLDDGDVVLAIEADDGTVLAQQAIYLDDDGLDWLREELAHASAVRAAIISSTAL